MKRASLILAGGASSRLWPLDGDRQPKFLLPVDGRTLLDHAAARAREVSDDLFIVTGEAQADLVRAAYPDLPNNRIIVEPARRDTAAAVVTGARAIEAVDPNSGVLVMPADVLITPTDALAKGVETAAQQGDWRDWIHVFAVEPARAEGGFGYIETVTDEAVSDVAQFHEKPGTDKAQEYVERGFLWNVGCFYFALAAFFEQAERHLPTHSTRLRALANVEDYSSVESISIDFGLIEKADNLRSVRLGARFDDLGTWNALDRAGLLDAMNGQTFAGETLTVMRGENTLALALGGRELRLTRREGGWVEESRRG